MIKRTAILIILICTLVNPVINAAGQRVEAVSIKSLTPFFADYEVRRSGVEIATAHYALWRDGDTYIYETRSKASGIGKLFGGNLAEEKSRFILNDRGLQQIDYKYVLVRGKEEQVRYVVFDWDTNKVNITRRGKTSSFKVANGVVDQLLLQLVVMIDIANNELKSSYLAVSKRSPKYIQFKKIGEELVEVPAGKFRTIKIEGLQKRRNGDRITRYWCAQELNWLPIKIEQYRNGDGPFEMKLSNIRGLGKE